jgi:hypothetical protein
MSVTLDCTSVRYEKKFRLSSDGGDFGSKKCKRGFGGSYGEVWRSLRLTGVWSQAVGFVLVRLAGTKCYSRSPSKSVSNHHSSVLLYAT